IANATITGAKIGVAEIDTLRLKNGTVTHVTMYSGNTVTSSASGGPGSSTSIGGWPMHLNHYVPSPTGVAGPFKTTIIGAMPVSKNTGLNTRIELTAQLYKNDVVIQTQRMTLTTEGIYVLGTFA